VQLRNYFAQLEACISERGSIEFKYFVPLLDKPNRDVETTTMLFPLPGETVDQVC
jgi:hypothetical protein